MEERLHSSSHRSGGEFFICFTARPSSSSAAAAASAAVMRVPSSKSLMSPARGRDPAAAPSLSASLSRRLRSSGSVKGAQSPMFPAGGRRKGCAFEPAEPSSPKVTCIGQVRVKSKKKHHRAKTGPSAARSRSQRGGGSGGEASFRRATEPERRAEECLPAHKHQGWVQQLPLAICEALRSLGSEFNCFLPCGGRLCSSSSTRDEEGEKPVGGAPEEKRTAGSGSCGAVFARWLMAIQESEEGKQREVVGLVVEEREMADVGLLSAAGQSGGAVEIVKKPPLPPPQPAAAAAEEEEEEGPRVSVCIPPKNALLLMRCRSDPVRMAALASRFWDSPAVRTQVVEEHNANEESELVEDLANEKKKDDEDLGRNSTQDAQDAIFEPGEAETKEEVVQAVVLGAKEAEEEVSDREEESAPIEESSAAEEQAQLEANPAGEVEETREEAEPKERAAAEEIKGRLLVPTGCSPAGQKPCLSRAKDVTMRRSRSSKDKERRRHSFSSEKDAPRHSFSTEREVRRASFSVDGEGRRRWSFSLNKENVEPAAVLLAETEVEKKEERNPVEEKVGARESAEAAEKPSDREEGIIASVPAAKKGSEEESGGGGGGAEKRRELPDCLLLMMYEPKLSMEVSKETWVCSTDFLRWRPHHGAAPAAASASASGPKDDPGESQCSESNATQRTNPAPPPQQQQQQQPAAPSAPPSATAVKMRLLSPAAAAAPVVLTRCKSEPMRSAARLAPDACLWKSRHQPIGAIGF